MPQVSPACLWTSHVKNLQLVQTSIWKQQCQQTVESCPASMGTKPWNGAKGGPNVSSTGNRDLTRSPLSSCPLLLLTVGSCKTAAAFPITWKSRDSPAAPSWAMRPGNGVERGTVAKGNAHFSSPVHKTSAQPCFPHACLGKILPKIHVVHMLQLPPKQAVFQPNWKCLCFSRV